MAEGRPEGERPPGGCQEGESIECAPGSRRAAGAGRGPSRNTEPHPVSRPARLREEGSGQGCLGPAVKRPLGVSGLGIYLQTEAKLKLGLKEARDNQRRLRHSLARPSLSGHRHVWRPSPPAPHHGLRSDRPRNRQCGRLPQPVLLSGADPAGPTPGPRGDRGRSGDVSPTMTVTARVRRHKRRRQEQPLWAVWRAPRSLATELPCDLATPLPGVYL